MALLSWFRRRPHKVIRILKGKGGNWRWTARIDGELMAVCAPRGYASQVEAQDKAMQTLGSGWDIFVDLRGKES